jgi:hypothetical protein
MPKIEGQRIVSKAFDPDGIGKGLPVRLIDTARPSLCHSTQISMLLSGLTGFTNFGRNLFAFIIPKTYIIGGHKNVDNPWRRNAR